ncbi:UDP-N-acetylmuramate dehydrogenase, partial [Myxococcota bacterium]|nr:UDP-N-acetylmuramate dehydrogenase [Myxococcota bacterium]
MSDSKNIYMMGICGTGMGALAGLLKKLGNNVTGSDENVYPPISDKLQEWGIPVLEGYDAAHLEGHEGLVVVGNVIRKVNPEATRARELGLEMISMAEALSKYAIADKHSIVVAGTHGKT